MVINTTTRDPPNLVSFYEANCNTFEPKLFKGLDFLAPKTILKHSYRLASLYWKNKDKQRYLMTLCAIINAYIERGAVQLGPYDTMTCTTTHLDLLLNLRQMVSTLKAQNTYVNRFFNTIARQMKVSEWAVSDHNHALSLLVSFIWASTTGAIALSKHNDALSQDNYRTIANCYPGWIASLESIIKLLLAKR